jgi:hypothetical protein
MIDEHFALHARSLFERTLHSMPGVFLDFALHARSLLFMNIFCSMPGVLMILRNIKISTAVTKLSPICKLT